MLSNLNREIIRLKLIPEIGNATILNLYQNFPELFNKKIKLSQVRDFLKPKQIKSFEKIEKKLDAKIEEVEKILEKEKIKIVNITDFNYPSLLREIPDLPILLFYKGDLSYNPEKSIAIVGTRKLTEYGKFQCERFTSALCAEGYSIISGLAMGIDSIAHIEALKNGSKCIGVIGSGHLHVFPESNWQLYAKVLEKGGCIISEFLPDEKPRREYFPMRNRIIAGMSKSTLVVEAAQKSGSIITAKLAFDYNREVYAVPADLIRQNSQGCNEIIQKDIAKLVISPQDIIEAAEDFIKQKYEPTISTSFDYSHLPKEKQEIVKIILHEPIYTDNLSEKIQTNIAELNFQLTELELEGVISRTADGKWFIG